MIRMKELTKEERKFIEKVFVPNDGDNEDDKHFY